MDIGGAWEPCESVPIPSIASRVTSSQLQDRVSSSLLTMLIMAIVRLSYLFVSILYGIVRIEASIAERAEHGIWIVDSMLIRDDRSAPGNALESMPLLSNEDDAD